MKEATNFQTEIDSSEASTFLPEAEKSQTNMNEKEMQHNNSLFLLNRSLKFIKNPPPIASKIDFKKTLTFSNFFMRYRHRINQERAFISKICYVFCRRQGYFIG